MINFIKQYAWVGVVISCLIVFAMLCIGVAEFPGIAVAFAVLACLVFGVIEKYEQAAFMDRWADELDKEK